jgi:hypothetical protein
VWLWRRWGPFLHLSNMNPNAMMKQKTNKMPTLMWQAVSRVALAVHWQELEAATIPYKVIFYGKAQGRKLCCFSKVEISSYRLNDLILVTRLFLHLNEVVIIVTAAAIHFHGALIFSFIERKS